MTGVILITHTKYRPKTDYIFTSFVDHENSDTPITTDTLALWPSDDPAAREKIRHTLADIPARNMRSSITGIDAYIFIDGLLRVNVDYSSRVVIPQF